MIDDFDVDFDSPEMDFDDFDDDDFNTESDYQPRTRFGSDFKQQFKLEKLKLKYANKFNKRKNAINKVAAKKQSKVALTISFAALMFKLMMDHHIDKLTAEEQRDLLKEAKKEGVPQNVAKKLVTMNSKQLAQSIASTNNYILKKAVTYNG